MSKCKADQSERLKVAKALVNDKNFLQTLEIVEAIARKRAVSIGRQIHKPIVQLIEEGYMQALFDVGYAQRSTEAGDIDTD